MATAFLESVEAAIKSCATEATRVASYCDEKFAGVHLCQQEYYGDLRALQDQVLPNLDPATLQQVRAEYPKFAEIEYVKGTFDILERTYFFRRSRARKAEVYIKEVRNEFWRWIIDEMRKGKECVTPSLWAARDLWAKLESLETEAIRVSPRQREVTTVLRNLQEIRQIYSRGSAIEPSQELVEAIAKIANALVGGVDESGAPVVHPDLLLKIRFGTFAYVEVPREVKQAV